MSAKLFDIVTILKTFLSKISSIIAATEQTSSNTPNKTFIWKKNIV